MNGKRVHRKAILAGEILTPERIISDGYLLIEGDRLVEVGRVTEGLPTDCRVFDASSHRVTPGLIDLHLHGAMGHNVMGPGLTAVAEELPKHGVTSFLPTTLTADAATVHAALGQMAGAILQPSEGARPLGIHLEGPHLSPRKAGMAAARHFRPLTAETWRDLRAAAKRSIKMLTFAPEEGDAMQLIPRLIGEGVVPSIGHSVATFEQVTAMVELGLRHASHMFNAMGPFHHRAPGVVGAVLYHREIVAQLIADLHHVHPAAMALLFRLKGADHVALVSDAAPVAGLPPGAYDWDAETRVIVGEDGTCRLPDGTLAGATSLLHQNVANLVRAVGLGWPEALQTATAVPGEALDVRRGRLRAGWMADVVVWGADFQPVATMVEGRWVWRTDGGASVAAGAGAVHR
ncbi:MAG: N-acetylglucosamine-6-phosphate deacetylase [Anaerolineae bacterium]|jgi:N-acetylglucosamine-6-phosphate deacetylase